jgi:pantoate--beta-alanine ligase
MKIIRTTQELRQTIGQHKKNGKTIGFAPTMGALHEGHMSLFDIARKNADVVIASIFVNPAQFAPHEDFDSYPRREAEDLAKLEQQGVDIAYLPQKNDLYPQGFDLKISVGEIGQELEGVTRPHFFDGVALVVTKLFMLVQPDVAVFGEKDFQQLHVIRKLAAGLDIPVKILGAPVIREQSGLAMSSRNLYLKADELAIAAGLYRTMQEIKAKITGGQKPDEALAWGEQQLLELGFDKVDYLALRDAQTLATSNSHTTNRRLLAAAYLGKIRLIDNIEI